MNIPTIPDWAKRLPDSTILMAYDIGEFFGYDIPRSQVLGGYTSSGLIPEPIKLNRQAKKNRTGWLLGDIRKLKLKMESEPEALSYNEILRRKLSGIAVGDHIDFELVDKSAKQIRSAITNIKGDREFKTKCIPSNMRVTRIK